MEKIINLEEKSLYEFIINLKHSDIGELIENSKSKEEEDFYWKLQELILRIQQEKIIAEGIF
ncbi:MULTISPECIES: hypothetical protein [Fusobacterium]|uniref:hypothetical protein n=1 Tax=Fusobacterium TaxID=848 RepID=UPI001476EBE3|nr:MULTISPECIES: hypothetical protein [Fusobacterium]NME35224.1 hypothetical protein [Fusobacterium sp. FSA-380-WT-3A]